MDNLYLDNWSVINKITRVSQKFGNILVVASLWLIYHVINQMSALVCSIMVVGVLMCCALLYSVWFESHIDEYTTV